MLIPRHTVLRPKSNIIITNEFGPPDELDCVQCVHCTGAIKIVAGSGKKRGFCMKCMGPTCGQPDCENGCRPAAKLIYGKDA
jgi:hypothetical protein